MGNFTKLTSTEVLAKPVKQEPVQPMVIELPDGYEAFVCYTNYCQEPVLWMVKYGKGKDDFSFTCADHAKFIKGDTYIRKEYIQQYIEGMMFNIRLYEFDWYKNNMPTQPKQKSEPKLAVKPIILKGSLTW